MKQKRLEKVIQDAKNRNIELTIETGVPLTRKEILELAEGNDEHPKYKNSELLF